MQADTYIPRRLDDQWKIGFWDVDVAAPILFMFFVGYLSGSKLSFAVCMAMGIFVSRWISRLKADKHARRHHRHPRQDAQGVEASHRGSGRIRTVTQPGPRHEGATGSDGFGPGNRLDQISKNVADSTGLTQSHVAQIAFGAAGHLGINTPIAGAELQARAGKNYISGLSAAQQKVLNSLTQEQIAEFKQFGDRVSRDSSVINSFAKDSREAEEMSSRLASAVSRSERADATFAERTGFAERLSSAKERGESLSIDIAQDPHNLEMFLRYAERYGGDSASALSMFDAELARQGLRPNRVFSDGTALPSSFGDVRTLHDRQSSDPALSPDLSASNRQQRARVARSNQTARSAHSDTSPPSLRNDVQTQGNAIRNETASARSTFDRKAELVDTADGTLATRKSLLKQSGKQVVDDGEASIDNAKEAVKGLLRKNE